MQNVRRGNDENATVQMRSAGLQQNIVAATPSSSACQNGTSRVVHRAAQTIATSRQHLLTIRRVCELMPVPAEREGQKMAEHEPAAAAENSMNQPKFLTAAHWHLGKCGLCGREGKVSLGMCVVQERRLQASRGKAGTT